jgi:uncharacterized membrane protein
MDMELQFPGDVQEARARSSRNVSEPERWASVAAGAGLVVYGLRRRSASGLAVAAMGGMLIGRGASGHSHTYEALGLNTAANGGDTRRVLRGRGGTLVDESVTVNRPAAELYAYWRKLDNLPKFMKHLESVEQTSDTVSRWKARSLGGKTVTWSAEIINEVPNVLIAWRSLDGSAVVSAGSVHFDEAGAGRGTRLRVRMQYSPPGGKLGTLAARMTGQDAATEVRVDLRRFKQLLEAGEVATTEGQPRGRA